MIVLGAGVGFLLLVLLYVVLLIAGVDGFGGQGGGSAAPAAPSGGNQPGAGAPAPTPGASSGSPGVGGLVGAPSSAGQPVGGGVPAAQPGAAGVGTGTTQPPAAPVPAGQAANPFAALPADVQAQIQQWQRSHAEWERNRHFAQLGYQQWQRAQQPPGQPAPSQGSSQPQRPANPFGVPAFDLGLLQFISRNPQTGQVEAHPNAPPGLVQQAQEYQARLAEATHGFFTDPRKYLGDMVRELAREEAQRIAGEHLGGYQQQQFAQQTLAQNADWLYERDAAGNTVADWDVRSGRPVPKLSAWGQEYARRVAALEQAGVRDSRAQHELAVQHVQNLALMAQYRQQQGAQQGQQQQQQFLQTAQQAPPGVVTPAAPVQPPGPGAPASGRPRSLRDMLDADLRAGGVTDQSIRQSLNGAAA